MVDVEETIASLISAPPTQLPTAVVWPRDATGVHTHTQGHIFTTLFCAQRQRTLFSVGNI